MRRSYTLLKRRRNSLCMILAVSALLFVSTYVDTYKEPYLKEIAEKRLNEISHRKIKFEIAKSGSIEGGIFRDIIIRDVLLNFEHLNIAVKLERVELPYKLWYPLLKKNQTLSELFPKMEIGAIFLFFGGEKSDLRGFLSICKASPDTFNLVGRISIFNKDIPLEGKFRRVDDSLHVLELGSDKKVRLEAKINSGAKEAPFNIAVRHLGLFGVDVVCDISGNFYGWDSVIPTGNFTVKNLIINYKPFKDIAMAINIDKKSSAVDIVSLNIGEAVRISGRVNSEEPYYTNLAIYIEKAHLEDFNFSGSDKSSVYGDVDGEIYLDGPIRDIITKGHINAYEGFMGDLEFDSIFTTLVGKGPIVKLEDGRVFKDGGSLILAGEIDFGKLKEGKIFENINFKIDKNLVVWEGWQITKKDDRSSVEAAKKIGDDFNLKFRSFMNKNRLKPDKEEEKGEFELEYKVDKHESMKMNIKADEEFLGLERKVKF